MRIAILGPYFWPQVYGIEKIMYAHAKNLADRGHEVLVITSRLHFPAGIQRDLPAFETHDSFSIRRLDVVLRAAPFIHYPSKGGLIVSGLNKALTHFRPDVVHAHNIGAAAWALGGAAYAQRAKAAFFYSAYHHPNKLRFNGVRKAVIRAMNYLPLRTASKIYHLTSRDFDVFPSDYGFAARERFAVLLTGVDPPHSSPSPNVEPNLLRLLFVGRVDDVRKGFAVLESAVDALPKDVRKYVVLTVVGSISSITRERLEAKYGSTIHVLGPVSEADLEQAYADADVFAMPSLYEGFGMPYIEAMRYGVPVIGTNAGGTPEIVPEQTGILTAPGDAHAVATAIERFVSDADLRSRMGAAGRTWSQGFYWNTIIDGLEADYRRACESV